MGYGPVRNGRHTPITPFAGSWADTVNRNTNRTSSVRCTHGLGLNCLKCYPTQYGKTNARIP